MDIFTSIYNSLNEKEFHSHISFKKTYYIYMKRTELSRRKRSRKRGGSNSQRKVRMKEKLDKLEAIIKELDTRVGDKIKSLERTLDQDDERIDEVTKSLRKGFMYMADFESKVNNALKQNMGVELRDNPNEIIPEAIV
jgi:hypothetical protein